MRRASPQRGLTLVETMVVVVVAGVLAGVAAPSFVGSVARLRLEGAVNELSVDLQYARSVSLRRRAAVTLATAEDGRSYAVTLGNETLKTVNLPAGVSLSGNTAVAFDPLRGTAAAATFDAASDLASATLRVSTSAMGRVQLCSPNGGFAGYGAC